jgi:transcription-repair coupling factor (superfamily II helicase)
MARAEQANKNDGMLEEEWSPQINVGTAVLIPETYVADLGLRLNLYRRIGSLKTKNNLESFAAELIDRFGPLPREVHNLIAVIELKILCRRAHIAKIELGPKGLVVSFHNNTFPNQQGLFEFLQKPEVTKPGPVKIRPDQKLVFTRQWPNEEASLRNTKNILANLAIIAEKVTRL